MSLKEIAAELNKFSSVLIFCHTRPDGDTLGCATALKIALEKKGKKADIICDSAVPEKFGFIPAINSVVNNVKELSCRYEAHVAVDCSVEGMMGETYYHFVKSNNTFNIDHHISNSKYAKFNYVENRAACCEIMYEFLTVGGFDIDEEVSTCLMLGICTDTGYFIHSNVTDSTLFIASELLKRGAKLHEIGKKLFKSQKKARALLYADVTSKIRFYLDDKLAMISIMKQDLEKFDATSDMTEGFIDFPVSIEGVEVAVSILENKPNCYKISFRSSGKVDVNKVAASFGGGGHILASGCMINGFFEDVKDKVIRAVSLYL